MKINTWGAGPGGRLFNGPTVQLVTGLRRGYSIVGDWKEKKHLCFLFISPNVHTCALKAAFYIGKRTQL